MKNYDIKFFYGLNVQKQIPQNYMHLKYLI